MKHVYFVVRYVHGISVLYGNTGAPSYTDINEGFHGKEVQIKPIWTYDKSKAASGFELVISDIEDNTTNNENIANGSGGKFRYIIPKYTSYAPKITDILIVQDRQQDMNCTDDINKERLGPHLYLCWEFEQTGRSTSQIAY